MRRNEDAGQSQCRCTNLTDPSPSRLHPTGPQPHRKGHAVPDLLDAVRRRRSDLIADVLTLVSCESPSGDMDRLNQSAAAVSRLGHRLLGERPEVITVSRIPNLRWQLGEGPGRVLLLGHHDTVWPRGTLERRPASSADGVLRGPGCLDMKAGLVIALHACALARIGSPVTVLVTGDEETGSEATRELIESTAKECEAVLVLEAAADGGALKTARKGVAHYRVWVTGRAAHAGLDPENGVNATVEAAHQVLEIASLADPDQGTTVTPGVVRSGTTANTVPAQASITVDVRAWSAAEQARVDASLGARTPYQPDARVSTDLISLRPPFEESASSGLFQDACVVARSLGLPGLKEAAVGGGSDGNLTASLGIPTLDGLGAVGAGAHAEHEHVLVSSVVERTALVAGLIDTLTGRQTVVSQERDR